MPGVKHETPVYTILVSNASRICRSELVSLPISTHTRSPPGVQGNFWEIDSIFISLVRSPYVKGMRFVHGSPNTQSPAPPLLCTSWTSFCWVLKWVGSVPVPLGSRPYRRRKGDPPPQGGAESPGISPPRPNSCNLFNGLTFRERSRPFLLHQMPPMSISWNCANPFHFFVFLWLFYICVLSCLC